jgi:hypothetical protein
MSGNEVVSVLQVSSGLHRGARHELRSREYLIGCDDHCDIVLRDPAIADRHGHLVREGTGFSLHDIRTEVPWPIEPRAIHRSGGQIESEYEIGGVIIGLQQRAPVARHGGREAWMTYGVAGVGLAAALTCVVVVKGALAQPGNQPIVEAASTQRATLSPDVLAQVKHVLASEGLNVGLQDGRLSIAGTTRTLEVKDRIRALREDLRGIVAIDDRVAYLAAPAPETRPIPFPVALRGVMMGQPSYFLTDRGERYYVGGVLPDGAEIIAIERDQIRARLRGHELVYNLK